MKSEVGFIRWADVDLGLKPPRRNWDPCRVSQEGGGPGRETSVEKTPGVSEMVGLCPTEAKSLAEECWSPRQAPKPMSDPDKLGKQAHFSRLSSAQQCSLKPEWRKSSSANSPLGLFLWISALLSPPCTLISGVRTDTQIHLLSTSPTPMAHPPSHKFILCYFHSTTMCDSYFKPHFYLGLFFMKFLLHMKGFPLFCSFIIGQGLHFGFSKKTSSALSLFLNPCSRLVCLNVTLVQHLCLLPLAARLQPAFPAVLSHATVIVFPLKNTTSTIFPMEIPQEQCFHWAYRNESALWYLNSEMNA